MAIDNISIYKPVTVVSDAKQRVAYDLMLTIGTNTFTADKEDQKTREYWLKLYSQCYRATEGNYLESILKEE